MLEPCWCVGVGTQSVIFWLNLSFRGALFQDKYSFSTHFLPLPCLQSSKSISLKPLTSVDYVMFLFLFLPQWGRKAGGGWSREEFPYSSWNQVSEFSPAKSLPLESKPLLWKRFWTVFPHAYSSAPARPMRGSCLYPCYGNLVEFLEWKPVKVCPLQQDNKP